MVFVARIMGKVEGSPRVRAYVTESAVESGAFGSTDFEKATDSARNHLAQILRIGNSFSTPKPFDKYQWMLGVIWGDKPKSKYIEFFGYHGLEDWDDAALRDEWVCNNGHYVGDIRTVCEDTAIMVGTEALARRKNFGHLIESAGFDKTLEAYMKNKILLPNEVDRLSRDLKL
jgi:hypothetical protein